jgi:hypothetical protein
MPQGHFNVLKGAYPTLQQLDESLAVDAGEPGIVRGSAMRKEVSGSSQTWVRTAADAARPGWAPGAGPVIYFSLQDQGQPDVTKSGVLTGIPCTMPNEVETDQYDSGGTFTVGGYVMAGADGEVTDHTDELTAIGVVTNGPAARYANDAVAVAGVRTGARINVITFLTIYHPQLSIS